MPHDLTTPEGRQARMDEIKAHWDIHAVTTVKPSTPDGGAVAEDVEPDEVVTPVVAKTSTKRRTRKK